MAKTEGQVRALRPSKQPTGYEAGQLLSGKAHLAELPARLRTVLHQSKIHKLTEVQARCYAPAIAGADLLVRSETGSGKTLAFCLPVAARPPFRLKRKPMTPAPEVLILCPGRELCQQVAKVLEKLCQPFGKKISVLVGGESLDRQLRHIRFGVDIIVATPGRVCDFLQRQDLSLSTLQCFVLDEVDMMLGKGFEEELNLIRRKIRPGVQTLFFSATLTRKAAKLAERMLCRPIRISEGPVGMPPGMRHGVIGLENRGRPASLLRLLEHSKARQALIFCETTEECSKVGSVLKAVPYRTAVLHGGLNQTERQMALRHFREKRIQFLITTNLGSRGLDIPGLPVVINYRLPGSLHDYTHRAGRTARAGQRGTVWNLLSRKEKGYFSELCNRAGIRKKSLLSLP